MKKGIWGFYVLYFACCAILLASGCDKLSGGKPEKVSGTIISVDAAKKEVVIKDSSTGKQRSITVSNDGKLNVLKPGMDIKARVKRGTSVAEHIRPKAAKGSTKTGEQKAGEE